LIPKRIPFIKPTKQDKIGSNHSLYPNHIMKRLSPFILVHKITGLTFLLLFTSSIVLAQTKEPVNVEKQLKVAIEKHHLHFPILTSKIYLNRFNQSIWFNHTLNDPLLKNASDLINTAPEYGLSLLDYHCEQLSTRSMNLMLQNNITDGLKPMLDILMTDALLTFIAHLHYGKANEQYPIAGVDQDLFKGLKVDSVLNTALNSVDFKATILNVQPQFKGYKELQQYTKLVARPYNGACNKITDDNYGLLALNLERWKWLNPVTDPYLIINIPSFNLTYYHQNETEDFKVIIGKSTTKTPVLSSKIRFFTTAPNWTVPKSIIKKELIPKALKNGSYLSNNHLAIYDQNGNYISPTTNNLLAVKSNLSDYSVVQSPGAKNALGQIKFSFDNSFSVYLHDTPNRNLFDKTDRALSHGCIRVQNPERLVELFLENDQNTSELPEVLSAMEKYDRKRVYLKYPFPIMVVYLTAEVKNGLLNTYKD